MGGLPVVWFCRTETLSLCAVFSVLFVLCAVLAHCAVWLAGALLLISAGLVRKSVLSAVFLPVWKIVAFPAPGRFAAPPIGLRGFVPLCPAFCTMPAVCAVLVCAVGLAAVGADARLASVDTVFLPPFCVAGCAGFRFCALSAGVVMLISE